MDVAYEMAKVRAKVQRDIDRSAIIATAKVLGIEPIEYARQLDAKREADRLSQREKEMEAIRRSAEPMGQTLRAMADSWKAMMEGISRGFEQG